jgi:hypothetical protein
MTSGAQLDTRRVDALTMIRDKFTSAIKRHRELFIQSKEIGWTGGILASYLAFGYLKLESESCLKSQDPGGNVDAPYFQGVSFAAVKECILSTKEFFNWNLSTIPIADRLSETVAAVAELDPNFTMEILTQLRPTLANIVCKPGYQAQLKFWFEDELAKLTEQIGRYDWEIDLDQIRE